MLKKYLKYLLKYTTILYYYTISINNYLLKYMPVYAPNDHVKHLVFWYNVPRSEKIVGVLKGVQPLNITGGYSVSLLLLPSTLVQDSIMQNACQDLVTFFVDETNFLVFHWKTRKLEKNERWFADLGTAKLSKIENDFLANFGKRFHFSFDQNPNFRY